MTPRASRIADIAASVPEDTRRTDSTLGTASTMRVASSTSPSVGIPNEVPRDAASAAAATIAGWAWPNSSAPQDCTRST